MITNSSDCHTTLSISVLRIKRWFCYNKVYNKLADYKVPVGTLKNQKHRPHGPWQETEEAPMDRELLNYTQNRELSWLRFDQRVLEEARDKSVPLLERMKFVAIFTSNLDEFFMIRVGSLYDMVQTDDRHRDSRSGMTPQEQLDAIYAAVAPLYKERDKTYAGIKKELSPYGVCGLDFKELEADEKKYVKKCFKEQILPVLSPQIVDSSHPFPHLMNKDIYVTANLKHINSRKNKTTTKNRSSESYRFRPMYPIS